MDNSVSITTNTINNYNKFNNEPDSPPNLLQSFDPFEDKKERRKFIRKTFGFFLLSIFTTFGSCLTFKYFEEKNHSASKFLTTEYGQAITILSFVTIIMCVFSIICCDKLLRISPSKYIIYGLFTLALSWNTGITVVFIKTNLVISAMIITIGTVSYLTMYAIISKSDFTGYDEYYVVALIGIILTATINLFLNNGIIQILLAGIGCILFSCFIVYDVQMIVAHKHIKYRYSINDSIFAAMSLYLDTINFFIYLLQCFVLTTDN